MTSKQHVPSNQYTRLAAGRLRKLADWLDEHNVLDSELVMASTDGWNYLCVHLKSDAACLAGMDLRFDQNGHARFEMDGVSVVASLPTKREKKNGDFETESASS